MSKIISKVLGRYWNDPIGHFLFQECLYCKHQANAIDYRSIQTMANFINL